ncbi:MAG: hypothetical protein HY689_06475 [Chloroflexi bacterium]|nr:hypothetical protein [Chloroflexota bacterium]
MHFVQERPVSAITPQSLDWCCQRLAAVGRTALGLVWDNASWHSSAQVRQWIREHNRQVRRSGQGVRSVVCGLPVKAPWRNPLAPQWVHGKGAVVEPDRLLTAAEHAERVCAYYDCAQLDQLSIPPKVS